MGESEFIGCCSSNFTPHHIPIFSGVSPLVAVNVLKEGSFHLLKNTFYFPWLILNGITHYWKYVFFFQGS